MNEKDNFDVELQEQQNIDADDEIKERPRLTKKERVEILKKERKQAKHLQKQQQKSLKKSQKQEKKREVLSYEDMPLSSREELVGKIKTKKKLGKKKVILIIAIVVLLALLVFLFSIRDSLTFDNIRNFVVYGIFNSSSEERFPVNIQGASVENGNFTRMEKCLAFSSDTSFSTYNNYGKCLYTSQISFSRPILVAKKTKSLIYNLGGKGFTINSLDENLYNGTTENDIIVADIVDNGTYAVVTACDGYLSKIFVYNENNEQIFAYSFADYYITSVSLDSSGKKAVLSGLSALDGGEISSVYVLDFAQQDPIVFKEFTNNIIYNVRFLSNDRCSIIGNTACYSLKVSSSEFTEYSYESKILTAFDVNDDTDTYTVSLSRSGDSRNCDIVCFSQDGKVTNTIETDLQVVSMSTYKNRIALLSNDNIYLYNKNGNLLSEKEGGVDPHAIVLYDTNSVYVLKVSEIARLDL